MDVILRHLSYLDTLIPLFPQDFRFSQSALSLWFDRLTTLSFVEGSKGVLNNPVVKTMAIMIIGLNQDLSLPLRCDHDWSRCVPCG